MNLTGHMPGLINEMKFFLADNNCMSRAKRCNPVPLRLEFRVRVSVNFKSAGNASSSFSPLELKREHNSVMLVRFKHYYYNALTWYLLLRILEQCQDLETLLARFRRRVPISGTEDQSGVTGTQRTSGNWS
jgi:hypothetical protein